MAGARRTKQTTNRIPYFKGVGALTKGIGKLGEISGEGIEKAGQKIEKAGKAINTTGAEITDKGFGVAGKVTNAMKRSFNLVLLKQAGRLQEQ